MLFFQISRNWSGEKIVIPSCSTGPQAVSWRQQFTEASRWCRSDSYLQPLFYSVCVCVCVCVSAVSSQILEVTDPLDSHHLLAELCRGGELIQRLSDHQPRLRSAARDSPGGRLASSYSIFAMLPPRYAAPEHRAPPRRPPGHLRTPD